MTVRELLERARGVPTSHALLLAVALAAIVLTCQFNAVWRAESKAMRVEAEMLRQKGLVVAAQEDARGMRKALASAVAVSEELAAELERAKRASPGVRPVAVVRGTTGPVRAAGAARPADPPPGGGAPPAGPCTVCLLAEGDQGEIRVEEVHLETKSGNRLLVGVAGAYRVLPAPETRLFGGPLLGEFTIERPQGSPGHGLGLAGHVGADGWQAGVAWSPPPRRVWKWQGELVVSGTAGPTGEWSIGATAVARRWR